jgi:hypothetical protein
MQTFHGSKTRNADRVGSISRERNDLMRWSWAGLQLGVGGDSQPRSRAAPSRDRLLELARAELVEPLAGWRGERTAG